ncbi:MAG: hypothetical protein ABI837_08820 [Acidobacteriota bacterium]
MDFLYVSERCPGCQQVLNTITRVNPKILANTTVKWVDRDPAANAELQRMGGKSVPAFLISAGTPHARLFSGSGEIHNMFASRYSSGR